MFPIRYELLYAHIECAVRLLLVSDETLHYFEEIRLFFLSLLLAYLWLLVLCSLYARLLLLLLCQGGLDRCLLTCLFSRSFLNFWLLLFRLWLGVLIVIWILYLLDLVLDRP